MLKVMDPDNLPKFVYLHNNYKYRLKLGFYAAPSNPKIFSKAVKDELNKLKFTYCSDLNGLVMGFGKINSNELIQADVRHCINVVVNVDVYIFRPPVGSIIKAIVNQTSDNHVSCLVHNLFNVSIVRPEHQQYNQWPGSKIKKDDKINVKVLSFDLTKKLPHITGDIVDNKYIDDEPDNCSEKCSSSTKESVSGFIKSIEHIEKRDTDSSSKLLLSDSESFDEVDDPITCSKTFENRLTKTSLLNQTTNHNDNHIKGPLFSSTPVSNSEHSVNNINLIRNKQLKQLHKHLAKNAEKEKSLDYVKSEIKLNLPATSIISNDNSGSANKINRQRSLQSDSGISDDDHKQINFPIQNAFSNTPGTSTKINEKHRSSNKIIGSILHSSSKNNKIKHETNVSKHNLLFDFNTDRTSDDDEEKSVYTQNTTVNDMINSDEEKSVYNQHIHDLKNSDEEMFYNCKSTNEATIQESTTLRLNTRNIQKSNVPQNKYLKDCRKKIVKEHSNKTLSMMSYSESSSENENLPIKEINHQSNLSKKIEKNIIDIPSESKVDIINTQYISSSDDEVYTKFRQNISKNEDTIPLTEQTKSQQIFISDNENNKSISFHNTISTILKVIDNTNNCNVNNNDNNILLEIKKMCNKIKQVKTNSTLESLKCSNDEKKSSLNLFIENNNQNEIIGHNIGEATNSDNEISLVLSNEMLKKEKAKNIIKTSILESSIGSNTKKKVIPNLISEKNKKNENIGHYSEDTSYDDEVNLLFNKKNKITPNLVSEENKKNENIEHNLEEDSSSDDGMNKFFSANMSKKLKQVNEKESTLKSSLCSNKKKKVTPNLVSEENKKNENIEHNLEVDSSSDNEVDLILSNETLKKENGKNVIKTSSILKSLIGSNTKKKVIPNLISKKNKKNENIGHNLEEDTNNDDEMNLLFNKKNKIIPNLVNEENKKNKKIEHNLEEDSSSDDGMNKFLSENMSKKLKQVNEKESTLKSSLCSNKKKKVTSNLISEKNKKNENIEHNLEEDSSSDNEVDLILSNKTFKKEKGKNVNKPSSILESSIGSNKKKKLTQNLGNEKNKNEIIKHILKDNSSSNDKTKCTSLKSNITDEYKIKNQNKSNKIPTSVLNLNENTCTVLKKNISNPFIKLYTQNLISSSSDDEAFINLTKSKDIINHSSKKKYSSLIKDINKKEDIIKEVLTSIKHKNKKQKQMLPIKHNILSSKDSLVKIKKLKKEKSIVSTKDKKAALDKLNNPIDKLESNTMSQNIYLKDSQLQVKLNYTNDSTDDEIDVIKNFLRKKQKLNKINNQKIELSELSMKNDIESKSNNLSEISEKLNKKPKTEKASTAITNALINNIIKTKKKRPKETKKLLLDNITNSFDDSSINHIQSKKKRKDHNATIKTDYVSKDTMFYEDLPKVKKKKKHNEDIKLNDLTVQNNKNQYNSSIMFEQQNTLMQKDTFMDITKKKKTKKVKSDPIRLDTQNTITDKSKLNDKLANKHIVKYQGEKGSNKKNVKLMTRNEIQTLLLSQNTDALDNLYKNLSCNN